MITVTQNFGTVADVAGAALNSLADGAYWQSASINNSVILGLWLEIFLTIVTTTTAGNDGSVDVYIAPSIDGGTDFAGGASGSQGSYSDSGNVDPDLLTFIGSVPIDASETTARTYEGYLQLPANVPEYFSIVLQNNTGAALASSGHAVEYRLNKFDSA